MPPAEPVAADSSPTDAALIAAWQGGDEQAATELVRRHARALARFLAGAGAPEADLDDVVQETFIRAFRAVATFRGQCRFRTWLLTIGGNVLKDAHRRAKQKSTRLNSSHRCISYAVFCLKKKKKNREKQHIPADLSNPFTLESDRAQG